MAAIATIADAVPLHGENRVIAALGLSELRRPAGAGLRALFAVAALDPASKQITGFDVAFRLAPRINAAGRMDIASEVIELFSTRDSHRGTELAAKLERLNRERRDAEAAALRVIEQRLASDAELGSDRLLVVDGACHTSGFAAEIIATVTEKAFGYLKSPPQRLTLPDLPTPTSLALANLYYPRTIDIINVTRSTFNLPEKTEEDLGIKHEQPLDVPDKSFTGPF